MFLSSKQVQNDVRKKSKSLKSKSEIEALGSGLVDRSSNQARQGMDWSILANRYYRDRIVVVGDMTNNNRARRSQDT